MGTSCSKTITPGKTSSVSMGSITQSLPVDVVGFPILPDIETLPPGVLEIKVIEAAGLEHLGNCEDPYIIMEMGSNTFKARGEAFLDGPMGCIDFDHEFSLGVTDDVRVLTLALAGSDRLSQENILGACLIPLETLVDEKSHDLWQPLSFAVPASIRTRLDKLVTSAPASSGSNGAVEGEDAAAKVLAENDGQGQFNGGPIPGTVPSELVNEDGPTVPMLHLTLQYTSDDRRKTVQVHIPKTATEEDLKAMFRPGIIRDARVWKTDDSEETDWALVEFNNINDKRAATKFSQGGGLKLHHKPLLLQATEHTIEEQLEVDDKEHREEEAQMLASMLEHIEALQAQLDDGDDDVAAKLEAAKSQYATVSADVDSRRETDAKLLEDLKEKRKAKRLAESNARAMSLAQRSKPQLHASQTTLFKTVKDRSIALGQKSTAYWG